MSLTRWLGLGLVSAAAIAAVVIGLTGTRDDEATPTVTVSAATTRSDGGVAFSLPDYTTSGQTVTEAPTDSDVSTASSSAGTTDAQPAQTTQTTPSVASGPGSTAAPASNVTAEVRLRIPALGVDARVTPLGFDGAGGFAVPTTAYGVGWYEFSAYPGAPGNAVLAGHLNWSGSRGVFDRLDELSPGDMIYVDTGSGELAFRVSRSHSVSADTPFANILGERSGPSTLTLFTCDGTYSHAAGEYDQRLVVDAVRA